MINPNLIDNKIMKIPHSNTNQKKTVVALLISDIKDVKAERVSNGKEFCYIMIKSGIYLQTTALNLYVPNDITSF